MSKIVTTDFEKALIFAVKNEFPESQLVVCYLHLNQALQRKLKKCRVTDFSSSIILKKIELLTIVPINQISTAIEYIKTLTPNNEN